MSFLERGNTMHDTKDASLASQELCRNASLDCVAFLMGGIGAGMIKLEGSGAPLRQARA
jgi:hypothetical protein